MMKFYKDGIITSLERISEYNIVSSLFEIVRRKNVYNLNLLVGNRKFFISTAELIKPRITNELFNVILFPFKYDNDGKDNCLVDEIDRIENILFFVPKYEVIYEKKIIKNLSKKYEYSKNHYELSKVENSIWGNFYIPSKALRNHKKENT